MNGFLALTRYALGLAARQRSSLALFVRAVLPSSVGFLLALSWTSLAASIFQFAASAHTH